MKIKITEMRGGASDKIGRNLVGLTGEAFVVEESHRGELSFGIKVIDADGKRWEPFVQVFASESWKRTQDTDFWGTLHGEIVEGTIPEFVAECGFSERFNALLADEYSELGALKHILRQGFLRVLTKKQ